MGGWVVWLVRRAVVVVFLCRRLSLSHTLWPVGFGADGCGFFHVPLCAVSARQPLRPEILAGRRTGTAEQSENSVDTQTGWRRIATET